MPLHVAVGAAEQGPGRAIYWQDDFFGNITASSYLFGNPGLDGSAGKMRSAMRIVYAARADSGPLA